VTDVDPGPPGKDTGGLWPPARGAGSDR